MPPAIAAVPNIGEFSDTETHLARKAVAEATGAAFLLMAVVGSGIAAERLAPGQIGLQLLINSLITGAALAALILALHPVSAAFNPIVTLAELSAKAIPGRVAAALIGAQIIGAATGTVLANLMFDLDPVTLSTHHRDGAGVLLGEVVATAGLVLVVLTVARTRRTAHLAVAVGSYITAAYWFTSSTSFANPAVTIARTLTDTFSGIAARSVLPFIAAQLAGAAIGYALVRTLHGPAMRDRSPTTSPV